MPNDDIKNEDDNKADEVAELKAKLEASEAKAAEYLDGWQRAKADFINARKEDEKNKSEFVKYANAGLLSDLIDVLDSFNQAMGNREAWEKVDKNWRVGVEYIYNKMLSVLKDNGLTEIGSVGEKLDLNIHQPIEEIETDAAEHDHEVAEIQQKGYKIGDKVIRPAKVKVYKLKI